MIVEAIFWFHPLVWWIGSRLVEARERACDEAVLGVGNRPDVYAEAILSVCRLRLESPAACVSRVDGAGVRGRIEAILRNRVTRSPGRAKRTLLTGAGAAALVCPVAIGLAVGVGDASAIRAQTPAPPRFEVASIKLCDPNGTQKRMASFDAEPGRLQISCAPLNQIVRTAWLLSGNGHKLMQPAQLEDGAPSWLMSDRYSIEAKTEVRTGREAMMGPMLQGLLEERFGLKLHRETKQIQIYELVVAKGGSKLTGRFNVRLQFELPPGAPFASRDVMQDQLPKALEKQLGLALRPAREKSDQFLVIDHIDRHPTAN
jgi:hypothetical protein